jgi:hypothetical protein
VEATVAVFGSIHGACDQDAPDRRKSMSESDRTGYRESPDTTDGPVAPGGEQIEGSDGEATLTTDDDAQREDSVERPGNEPD